MTNQVKGAHPARPLHRMPTYESLVDVKRGTDLNTHLTFIRNGPLRQPVRDRPQRSVASSEEKHVPKMQAPVVTCGRAYPSLAELRKTADDSVAQHVFPLVHAGRFSAAKALMKAYHMSPDTKLGSLTLEEVLDDSSAAPRDAMAFRRFLDDFRTDCGQQAVQAPAAREPEVVANNTLPSSQAGSAGNAGSAATGSHVGMRRGGGRPLHPPVSVPFTFSEIPPRGATEPAIHKHQVATSQEQPNAGSVEVTTRAKDNTTTQPALRRHGHEPSSEPSVTRRKLDDNSRAAGRPAHDPWGARVDLTEGLRGDGPEARTDPLEADDAGPSLAYKLKRRCVDPVRRVVQPAWQATTKGLRIGCYRLLYGEPDPLPPPPPPRWMRQEAANAAQRRRVSAAPTANPRPKHT